MADCDLILLGSSTWGLGDMQDDWVAHQDLPGINLEGKTVAVFGTGDQTGFSDSFVNAIGTLADSAEKAGAHLVGAWPTDGYDLLESTAVRNGRFVGLALDEDNQADQTQTRIAQWVAQLKTELGLC
jgi:flavodoxin I